MIYRYQPFLNMSLDISSFVGMSHKTWVDMKFVEMRDLNNNHVLRPFNVLRANNYYYHPISPTNTTFAYEKSYGVFGNSNYFYDVLSKAAQAADRKGSLKTILVCKLDLSKITAHKITNKSINNFFINYKQPNPLPSSIVCLGKYNRINALTNDDSSFNYNTFAINDESCITPMYIIKVLFFPK